MEQVKHATVAGVCEKRYTSPRTRVVFVKTHGIICASPAEGGTPGDILSPDDDNTWTI